VRIGAYEATREIGRGGSGVVFEARAADGKRVAIKILRRLDPDALARFDRERRLITELSAEGGFVPLLDAGMSPQGPYLVMPFLEGGTLRSRLEAGPLAIDETASLGRDLARALSRAHERGIVHRDLKPENVLFTADKRPLVADLGLAKHFVRDARAALESVSLSRTSELRGTPSYMSPELCSGTKAATPAADVFALGAILHECLTGTPVFLGDTPLEILTRIASLRVPPARSVRPEAPAWLAAAIDRALARPVAERFPDALALERALRAPEKASKRRAWLLLPAGVVAVLGLAFVLVPRERPAPATPARVAASPAPVATHATTAPVATAEAPGPMAPMTGPAREAFDRAMACVKANDVDGAIAELTRSVEIEPRFSGAFNNRAMLKAQKGDFRGAIDDYGAAIAVDPGNAILLLSRGSLRLQLQDRGGALEDFGKAIEVDPRNAAAFYYRGHLAMGEDGLADLLHAVELEPRFAGAWSEIGALHARSGKLDEALAALDEALAVGDATPGAPTWAPGIEGILRSTYSRRVTLENRGSVKARTGDLKGALADLDASIALDPKEPRPYANRSEARSMAGDIVGAIADAEKFLELAPNDPGAAGVRRGLAVMRARLGATPGSASGFVADGFTANGKKDYAGAIAAFTKAIELDPKIPGAWDGRGLARAQTGDLANAVLDFDRAIELEPEVPGHWGNRAIAKQMLNDIPGAIADFEYVLQLSPNDPKSGWVRQQLENLRAQR
jgi:tetratricopeptide (TPR) repeat protein